MTTSLQEHYFPDLECFGCGPANEHGLQIKSFRDPDSDAIICDWTPSPHHQAAPGSVNGGIVSTLLDCHSACAVFATADDGAWWVTANLEVAYKRPTPIDQPLRLHARVTSIEGDWATTEAHIEADGKIRATATARFKRITPRTP